MSFVSIFQETRENSSEVCWKEHNCINSDKISIREVNVKASTISFRQWCSTYHNRVKPYCNGILRQGEGWSKQMEAQTMGCILCHRADYVSLCVKSLIKFYVADGKLLSFIYFYIVISIILAIFPLVSRLFIFSLLHINGNFVPNTLNRFSNGLRVVLDDF